MASKDLKVTLIGDDRTGKAFGSAGKHADGLVAKFANLGKGIALALGGAAVAGVAGLGVALGQGIRDAASYEKITKQVAQTIRSTGAAAGVSVDGLKEYAGQLESMSGVDEELILSGQNVLLTFTKIQNAAGKGNDIFDQASEAALNLSTTLGTDLVSANTLVGKALNDPLKGLTALGRAGVQFTDQQKEQIKTMVASGDVMGAQKVILGELETQFGGAAKAAGEGLTGSIARAKDAFQDMFRGIATALLPKLAELAEFFADRLMPGIQGVYDLVVNGDFTGKLAQAFNIHEDNPVVGWVLSARDAVLHVWDGIGNFWGGLDLSGFTEKVTDALKNVGGTLVSGLVTGFQTGNWSSLGQALVSAVGTALGALGTLAGKLYESIKNLMGRVDWVGVGLEIGKQVPTLLAGLALGILNFDLGGLLSGLADHWFEVLMGILAIAFMPAKWIGKIGEMLGKIPLVGKFLEWGLNGIKGLTDNIVGWVGDVIGGFVRGFLGEGTKIGRAFKDIFETVKTQLFVWGDNVIGWFKGLPGRFVGAAEDLGGALRGKFDEIATYMGDAIRRGVGAAVDWLKGLGGRALGALGDMGSLLLNAGADLIRGFINGIKNMAGKVAGAAIDVAKNAVNGIKDFLGINSPSKVFMALGTNVGEGFVKGIAGMRPAVAAEMAALANTDSLGSLTGLANRTGARGAAAARPAGWASGGPGGTASATAAAPMVHIDNYNEARQSPQQVAQELTFLGRTSG